MNTALDYIIYGTPIAAGQPAEAADVLVTGGGLTDEDAALYRQYITLQPPDDPQEQAFGLFALPDGLLVLARAHHQHTGEHSLPVYQYIPLPEGLLHEGPAALLALSELLREAIQPVPVTNLPQPALELSVPQWKGEQYSALIEEAGELAGGPQLLLLLEAALDPAGLLVLGFPGAADERIRLAAALMALLPAVLRRRLTFATHTAAPVNGPRLLFADTAPKTTARRVVDWQTRAELAEVLPQHPYMLYLHRLWLTDSDNLLPALDGLDRLASLLVAAGDPHPLAAAALRHEMDSDALAGRPLPDAEAALAAMDGPMPPQGPLREAYLRWLLLYALEERSTAACQVVAQDIDAAPELYEKLRPIFVEWLADQPDAVYFFIRTRLAAAVDEHWLPRLEEAARRSLRVAIEDGDAETLLNWLKLVAREPAAYKLGGVLRDGLLTAEARAEEDGALGRELMLLAVRRAPDVLERLLANTALLEQLPDPMGPALRDHDLDAVVALAAEGREIFLLALARALDAAPDHELTVTPDLMQALWEVYRGGALPHLPAEYQPHELVLRFVGQPGVTLAEETLENLLRLILSDAQDDLFVEVAGRLREHEVLFPLLAAVFQQSRRSVNDILVLVGRLSGAGIVTEQQVVNIYIALLTEWNWADNTLPLAEQLARSLQKGPALTVSAGVLWKMLEIAADQQMETTARAAARRLLEKIEKADLDADKGQQVVENLVRLGGLLNWNRSSHEALHTWLRHYTGQLSLSQLQWLDKGLEGKKGLETARSILQTAAALRRMLGQRTLEDFAAAIDSAYTILGALASAFDPGSKHAPSIDPETIRMEIDSRADEITPDERHVLSKNLKELAQLIASMSENRSKASLMRSDDVLERQLISGEQQPQSAIDTMKWLSGYLGGAHAEDEEP